VKELLKEKEKEKERQKEKAAKDVNGSEKKDIKEYKPKSKEEPKGIDRRSSLDSSEKKSVISERRYSDPKPKPTSTSSTSPSSSPGVRPASENKLPKTPSNPSLLHAISSASSSSASPLSRTHLKPVNLLKKHSPPEKRSSSDNVFALSSPKESVILLTLPSSSSLNRKGKAYLFYLSPSWQSLIAHSPY